jgi:ATP-dependent Zn protease
VQQPDLKGCVAILEVHTRGKPLGLDVDLAQVARQTSGLTGAELANICNEAAIFAGRRGDAQLIQEDFDNALERVVAGLQQKKVLTEKERRILSYHEGGHALMAHLKRGDGAPEGHDVSPARRLATRSISRETVLHTKGAINRMVVARRLFGRRRGRFGRADGAANDLRR